MPVKMMSEIALALLTAQGAKTSLERGYSRTRREIIDRSLEMRDAARRQALTSPLVLGVLPGAGDLGLAQTNSATTGRVGAEEWLK